MFVFYSTSQFDVKVSIIKVKFNPTKTVKLKQKIFSTVSDSI